VVDKLIRALDNQERKLIYLRFWCNLTMETCAERLGLNLSVTRLTLLRAIDKMKDAV
jgi:DNA-directed RNA polymerase specialized sigma24 family protein